MRKRNGKTKKISHLPTIPAQETYPRPKAKKGKWHSRPGVLLLIIGFYALTFWSSSWWLYSSAIPLGLDAPLNEFSEARALKHVHVLSNEIGHRQVSTPGLALAIDYVLQECKDLASIANANEGLVAEVDKENTSGEYSNHLFRTSLASAFRNMTNIVLYIVPKGKENTKALLVNAHIDSAPGSTGASDCGVCVAIALEIARMVVQGNKPLVTPIMFLFNGGEETLLQAASGFMQSSKWVDKVGAFINLESTGAGGMPMLFQYSGSWALEAYVRGSKYPRGTVFAQDVFRSKLIPADTDFRMFSQDYYGKFPGVDIATVLDAGAYHTSRDSYDRIVPGTTQEYGDSVAGTVDEFLRVMADGVPSDSGNSSFVYFDLFHSCMVMYKMSIGWWLHTLPLLVIGVGFFVQANLYGRISGLGRMQIIWGVTGVVRAIISLILAITFPVILGGIWAHLTGKSMFWFSSHPAAAFVYAPMALIGTLIPWQTDSFGLCCSSSVFGICILLGTVGRQITNAGVASGYHLCWKALFGGFMGMFIPERLSSVLGIAPLLTFGALPVVSALTLMRVLCMHFMEKMNLMLASGDPVWGVYTPELVVAILIGFATWLTTILLAPYIVGIQTRYSKWLSIALLAVCSLGTLTVYGGSKPFTSDQPRLVHVDHVHNTKDGMNEAYWMISAWDPLQQRDIFPPVFDGDQIQETAPHDWLSCFPFNARVRGYRIPTSPVKVAPWGSSPPKLVEIGSQVSDEQLTRRISIELQWEKPGWVVMNMTGAIFAWSFGNSLPLDEEDGRLSYVLRMFQDIENPIWPFWVETTQEGELTIEIVTTYLAETEELASIVSGIPDYTTVVARTSSVSRWIFS